MWIFNTAFVPYTGVEKYPHPTNSRMQQMKVLTFKIRDIIHNCLYLHQTSGSTIGLSTMNLNNHAPIHLQITLSRTYFHHCRCDMPCARSCFRSAHIQLLDAHLQCRQPELGNRTRKRQGHLLRQRTWIAHFRCRELETAPFAQQPLG